MEIYDKAHAGKFAESLMSQRPRVWTASSLMQGENGYTFRVRETCRSALRLGINNKDADRCEIIGKTPTRGGAAPHSGRMNSSLLRRRTSNRQGTGSDSRACARGLRSSSKRYT